MSEQIDIQEFQLDLDQLHRRAADLTQELGNANYALREKRRELAQVNAAIEARVHERTQVLPECAPRLALARTPRAQRRYRKQAFRLGWSYQWRRRGRSAPSVRHRGQRGRGLC